MPNRLKRFQQAHDLHYITFTCYHRSPYLASPEAREVVETTIERVRRWYGFYINAYVVMPEHVHMLMTEPERTAVSVAVQMLKQITSRQLRVQAMGKALWQRRYYDFNVWSEKKFVEKVRYIHRNPVRRGLVEQPDEWLWSSFRQYAYGEEGIVEVESQWTARRRERLGQFPQIRVRSE